MTRFLVAMGVGRPDIHPDYTWVFNLDNNLTPLNMPARAILRISLRVLYKHLTSLEINGNPINKKKIKTEIASTFMARILAYQLYRRTTRMIRLIPRRVVLGMLPAPCLALLRGAGRVALLPA